ncbi:MAG: transaldolase [Betaproteobacteria bacterium]|nr:transaldolase [Betaproteobacteria bacterium]
MNALQQTKQLGQSIWLDNLSRTLIQEGGLEKLIHDDGVSGVTSNPAIFFNAISKSPYYKDDVARLKAAKTPAEPLYETLVIPDIQAACDLMRPEYERTHGRDGYVSLEVSPALAHDTAGTVAAGLRLKAAVQRKNLLIKVPATAAGLQAIEELIAQGCSVNVTLMFSLAHVNSVAQAYIRGLQRLIDQGGDPGPVKSVASLFLSRVDTLVDKQLEGQAGTALALRGKAGVALAKLAYREYQTTFASPAFKTLAARGAQPQFMLWASTGTKNPEYSDVLYVESLIGADTINTVPDATLAAFRDHGKAAATLELGAAEAQAHFEALAKSGIDMHQVGETLQVEGVKLFEQAFDQLLALLA